MREQRVHQIFEISVALKGIHAAIECVSGMLLALIGTSTITTIADTLAQDELREEPHDLVATTLLHWAQGFSGATKNFYTFYLISHGVIKLGLVVGLLRGKLWSYPASLVVLGLFIIYQMYRFSYTHGLGLIVLTVFDIVVLGLIWHEYQLVRCHQLGSGDLSNRSQPF